MRRSEALIAIIVFRSVLLDVSMTNHRLGTIRDHRLRPRTIRNLQSGTTTDYQRNNDNERRSRRRSIVASVISGASSAVGELINNLPSSLNVDRNEQLERNDKRHIDRYRYPNENGNQVVRKTNQPNDDDDSHRLIVDHDVQDDVNVNLSSSLTERNDVANIDRSFAYRQSSSPFSRTRPTIQRLLNNNNNNNNNNNKIINNNSTWNEVIRSDDEDDRRIHRPPTVAAATYHDYLSSVPIIGPLTHSILEELQNHVHLIKPGTKWCGDGNKARSYQDVGVLYKTDSCCRDHDKCSYYIPSRQTKYGLYNDGHWTRSHCDCDTAFYSCLKSVNSPFSTAVGYTYFNVLKMKCFKMEYPLITCVRGHGWISKSCNQYIVDRSKDKKWQWLDNYEF